MSRIITALFAVGFVAAVLLAADESPDAKKYFTITVVDEATGRGVPLIELRTVNDVVYVTDSNGIVAFLEPGLMDQSVFFHVQGHGYEFPKDGFGFRGKALQVKPGGSEQLKVKRINIAERLYRVTGGGIYRDTVLVGKKVPIKEPVLNGQVFGSDSVLNAVYKGKIHWFWGDTNRPSYPLGNFHVPGATSKLPSNGGLDPAMGVDFTYFVDDKGFAKPMAQMPGQGPTWIYGLTVMDDTAGKERMFAMYMKVRGYLEVYERGLVVFNDDKQQFEKVTQFSMDAPLRPDGHPFLHKSGDDRYLYFATPYPLVRVLAHVKNLADQTQYEAYTCLEEGTKADQQRVARDKDGKVHWDWKRNTGAVGPQEQAKLLRAGKLKPEEALLHLQDADTGKAVIAHGGSVYWNKYRNRWVMITVQSGGTSALGEVWYAEADMPTGPWVYARKIVTHDRQSFYNPKQHPMFDSAGGKTIFFEGTYTHSFSGNSERTPRYEYNQIMYRLNLEDTRLALPVAVYDRSNGPIPDRFGTVLRQPSREKLLPVAFFGLDAPATGTIPVYKHPDKECERFQFSHPPLEYFVKIPPMFYALPTSTKQPPATTTPLYEFRHRDGKRWAYSVDPNWKNDGFEREKNPLCLVWKNPRKD